MICAVEMIWNHTYPHFTIYYKLFFPASSAYSVPAWGQNIRSLDFTSATVAPTQICV